MKKISRVLIVITSILLVSTMFFAMTGCQKQNATNTGNNSDNNNGKGGSVHSTFPSQIYDKHGNAVQMPTDNDVEGWFSVEVVNQYSVASFTQPTGTKVVSKPEPNVLYLEGNENTFRDTVSYAFSAIKSSNSDVYLPILGIGADSVATVTSLDPITHIDTDTLYPKGNLLTVNLIYKSGHKAYECTISLQNDNKLVYVAFQDRTELYGPLM